MKFRETGVADAVVVTPELRSDARGAFARLFCRQEFLARGLTAHVEQANLSVNVSAGTVRGLHYQLPPSAEAKLVRCVRGAIFDVVVDLRRSSETFGVWEGVELTADGHEALLIPEGCAHGFQTLSDDSHVMYHVSAAYDPQRERGIHHDDSSLGIRWPLPVTRVSLRDAQMPGLSGAELP